MATKIETIIVDKFDSMPLWVRVTVYLTIVFSYLYSVIGPKYIDGRLIVRADGVEYAVRMEPKITMRSAGRHITVVADHEGNWAIPLTLTTLFRKIDLEIEVSDGGLYQLPLTVRDHIFDDLVKIEYKAASKKIKESYEVLATQSIGKFSLIRSAMAQGLPASRDLSIEQEVFIRLQEMSGEPMSNQQLKQYFNSGVKGSVTKISILLGKLKQESGISISDRKLRQVESFEELIDALKVQNLNYN